MARFSDKEKEAMRDEVYVRFFQVRPLRPRSQPVRLGPQKVRETLRHPAYEVYSFLFSVPFWFFSYLFLGNIRNALLPGGTSGAGLLQAIQHTAPLHRH